MYRLVVLAAALLCIQGAPGPVRRPRLPPVPRIVGGTEVAIEEVPYQVSLQAFGSHICGASIISADWAVTTAHCADATIARNMKVRSGSANRFTGGVLHDLSQIIIHDQYDSFLLDYDVAVIRVTTPFPMSTTTAVIPLATTAPATSTMCIVSGWGTTNPEGGSLPTTLLGVELPVYDIEACSEAYIDYHGITDRMICAGLEEGGKDSCQGDTGGPMVANGELVGLTSWGLGCAQAKIPRVYTNVAALRDWIVDNAGL